MEDEVLVGTTAARSSNRASDAEPAVLGADQVAQLAADQPGVVQGVFANHQFVPDEQVFGGDHFEQFQRGDLLQLRGHAAGRRDALGQAGRGGGPDTRAWHPRRRQGPQACSFKLAERLGRGPNLPVAFRVAQLEVAAELLGELGAGRNRPRLDQPVHKSNIIGLGQELFDREGGGHPPTSLYQKRKTVPSFLMGKGQG